MRADGLRYTIPLPAPLPCLVDVGEGRTCGEPADRSAVLDHPPMIWLCGPACAGHRPAVLRGTGYRTAEGSARFTLA